VTAVAARGKHHELPWYTCTNTVQCAGCFDAKELADADVPAETASSAAATPAPPLVAPPAPRAPMAQAPSPQPKALYAARWNRDSAPAGKEVELSARADGFPSGTTASIDVFDAADAHVDAVEGGIDGDSVSAAWTPPGPGRYRFDVTADGRRAQSPDLVVESPALPPAPTPETAYWLSERLLDVEGQPLAGDVVVVLGADGSEAGRATTDDDGFFAVRVSGRGQYQLRVVSPDDAACDLEGATAAGLCLEPEHRQAVEAR
jgi:hypothetical protein